MLKYQRFRGLQDEGRRPAFGEAERREIVENSGFMKSRCRFCSVATATPGSGTSDPEMSAEQGLEGPTTISVGDECGNDIEVGGYQMADDSPLPPLAWRNQSIEGVLSRIDATTLAFTSGDLELLLTSDPVDAICRPFSDEE